MHKEVDFIAEYNEEMKELLAEPQTSPSEREWQRFRLLRSCFGILLTA